MEPHEGPKEIQSAYGGVAQLGEHLPCKQGVRSSILLVSTTSLRGETIISIRGELFFENYIEESNVRKISRENFLRTEGNSNKAKKSKLR